MKTKIIKLITDAGFEISDTTQTDELGLPVFDVTIKGTINEQQQQQLEPQLKAQCGTLTRLGIYTQELGYDDVPAGHTLLEIDLTN